jgi:thiamine biosynthesis lipoprotein
MSLSIRLPKAGPKRARLSILAAALVSFLAGCDRQPGPETSSPSPKAADTTPALLTFQEAHMGTQFTIRLWAAPDQTDAAQEAVKDAFARVVALEMVFSDYQVDSEVVKLVASPASQKIPISPDLFALLDRSLTLSRESDGAFDVTVGPMVRLWRQARKDHRLPSPERIALARERSGWQKIELDPDTPAVRLATSPMQLDFGGIAKGYAADEALNILKQRGFTQSLVAASGDIALGDAPPGKPAWKVGIRSLDVEGADPASRALTGTASLNNAAISTSGDTQQAVNIDGVRYSHIVDPQTALGLTHRIAATVIGPDATTTDSYATTVCILGREKGLAFIESKPGVSCLILETGENGDIVETRSSRFPMTDDGTAEERK